MILSIKACVKIAACASAHARERPLTCRPLFSDLHFCDSRTKLYVQDAVLTARVCEFRCTGCQI